MVITLYKCDIKKKLKDRNGSSVDRKTMTKRRAKDKQEKIYIIYWWFPKSMWVILTEFRKGKSRKNNNK